MPFKPIEDYGVVGNMCSIALISLNSCVDFFCFPEFDSPTIFAALLDPEKGGSFSIWPDMEDMQTKQMYVAETNILVTRFLSEHASAEISDFMPVTADSQKNEIVRTIRVIHGEVRFHLKCKPRFDYARVQHTTEVNEAGIVFRPKAEGLLPVMLRGTQPLSLEGDDVSCDFSLGEGEGASFVFGEASPEGCVQVDQQLIESDMRETLTYWRRWSGQSQYKGRWREAVNRSALALKLLTSRKHGSLVAAATTSLPEHIGGERNWDYRYTWLRDASFTLYAFMRIGLREEANAFWGWLNDRMQECPQNGVPMKIMYALDGHSDLEEIELPHLRGYRDSKPVRIGNGASDQLQLDIFGELFDAIYLYSKYGHSVTHDIWTQMKEILKWLGNNWNRPDDGIWEVRGGQLHFLHSRLMCWVAFDRAIRLAHKRSLSAPLEEWYHKRDAIVQDIYDNFWDEELGSFVQSQGSKSLDGALLLMPLMRFISPLDPKWLSTLAAIEKSLAEDAFVYRYRHNESPDGLAGEEGSFTCCSFWLVECLARADKEEQARQLFDKLLQHANHLGLFSEEIGRDGHQLGNFPQALTHLALISAASYLDRRLAGGRTEPWS